MTPDKKIDLPPLPEPWQGFQLNLGWKSWENVVHSAMDDPGVTQAFTAQQMRDYVAADRARKACDAVVLVLGWPQFSAASLRQKQARHEMPLITAIYPGQLIENEGTKCNKN